LIRGSADPEAMLWTLWAAKEAAYKVVRKFQPSVCSIPRAYPVRLDGPGESSSCSGTVRTPAGIAYLRCDRDGATIHTIAASQPGADGRIVRGVEWVENGPDPVASETGGPSMRVRRALAQRLSKVLGVRPSALEVRRFKGPRGLAPPRLYLHGAPVGVDISLSHDGRAVAYAFSLF
jgi:hypothetical protein